MADSEGPPSVTDRLAMILATGFGTGYAPVASGTFGTLPAVLMLPWMSAAAGGTATPVFGVLLVALIAVAIWSADRCVRMSGNHDPSFVVSDEIAGFAVTMVGLPVDPSWLLAGFLAFRLFDIWKPPPCRWAEGLPGGVGVVADDLLAGVYANLLVRLLALLQAPLGIKFLS